MLNRYKPLKMIGRGVKKKKGSGLFAGSRPALPPFLFSTIKKVIGFL